MIDKETKELIHKELDLLTNKFGVQKPSLIFKSLLFANGKFLAGMYYTRKKKILLSCCHGSLHTFYHEFCHHLQNLRNLTVVDTKEAEDELVKTIAALSHLSHSTPRFDEDEADEFANKQFGRIKCKCGNPTEYEVETIRYELVVHKPSRTDFKCPVYKTLFMCNECKGSLNRKILVHPVSGHVNITSVKP